MRASSWTKTVTKTVKQDEESGESCFIRIVYSFQGPVCVCLSGFLVDINVSSTQNNNKFYLFISE